MSKLTYNIIGITSALIIGCLVGINTNYPFVTKTETIEDKVFSSDKPNMEDANLVRLKKTTFSKVNQAKNSTVYFIILESLFFVTSLIAKQPKRMTTITSTRRTDG